MNGIREFVTWVVILGALIVAMCLLYCGCHVHLHYHTLQPEPVLMETNNGMAEREENVSGDARPRSLGDLLESGVD